MKKIIKVTQSCINHGVMEDAERCPVAMALLMAGLHYVSVVGHQFTAGLTGSSGADISIPLPREVNDFVKDFDLGHRVSPFEFEIEIDERYL